MRFSAFQRVLPVAGTAAALLATACSDPLSVANKNNPDVTRSYATITGVETVVSKLFQQVHQGMYGSTTNLLPGSTTMSFESSSQLGNFCMGTRSALPRNGIDNTRGNTCFGENFRVYDFNDRNARSAANAITALADFVKKGSTLGSAAQDARARSFAYFNLGFALGEVALFYDSAAVIKGGSAASDIPALSGYKDVMAAALADMDSAFAIANSADATNGANGWPIPNAWVPTPDGNGISLDAYKRAIRSLRARFRANVGRTPAEHNAADWDTILADATNGLIADFNIQMTNSNGWSNSWWSQAYVSPGWSQQTPFIIGMADTSGAYAQWLETPIDQRAPFLIRTPDKRFPSGETRALQQAVTGTTKNVPAGIRLFYRNRPTGEDSPAFPWGTSYYDQIRYWGYPASNSNGPNFIMTLGESDMLAAEAYIRKGQVAPAVALVDKWRTLNGLPATGVSSLTATVAGGNACVPRIPAGPTFTTTACGTLLEAMKWEKRMETAFAGFSQWFLDNRGWGDQAANTPNDWPVPYQEMDARAHPFYNSQSAAAKGTYGF